jgi:hypothetical protein
VVRFWNHQIFEELDCVLEAIGLALVPEPPHPNPPPPGGREPEDWHSPRPEVNP